MGNTPSQQPFESGSQEGTEPVPNASLPARVARSVRSFFTTVRRRVLGRSTRESSGDDTVDPAPPIAAAESNPAPPARPGAPEYRDIADIPARDAPFTRPADEGDENRPDLQATESEDRLAIYYPNCPGATIESDTWERVER